MLTNLSERRPATIEDNIYAAGPIKKITPIYISDRLN